MTTAPRTLTLENDVLRLELVSTGAAVARLEVHGANVALGHPGATAYREVGGYLGAVIGRVGNRIDQGRFTLDGTTHQIPANNGPNALHGGPDGFDARDWTLADAGPEHATWTLVSPDGDQGFPGEVEVSLTYTLSGGRVTLDYAATTTAPTPLNLTHHGYVNLDGEDAGEVTGHVLSVDADAFLPTRPDQIPTGEIRPVEGTAFDLREPVELSTLLPPPQDEQAQIAGGIDHHFVVRGEGLRRHARLVGASGLALEVWSDRPGVQVYTGAQFDGGIVGTSGRPYGPYAGVALETQGYPDAVNHAHFPSVILRPGERFASTTQWRFSHGG
ncbi:aldose epimerase family protein [Serinicoccus profundi]|uniref:aldose epimerase family protein n=1 Tax=Serinicoccus profundi TaxID=1078471 RepID=UPI000255E38B|nr:aldose epimerase family protein [Serinicoccus profundi]